MPASFIVFGLYHYLKDYNTNSTFFWKVFLPFFQALSFWILNIIFFLIRCNEGMTFFLPPNRLTYLATAKLLGLQLQCAAHVGTTRQIEFHYSWIYSTWELTFQTHSNLWNISFGRWENVCICFFNEHQKLAWNPSWFFWWGPFQLCWDEKLLEKKIFF